MVLTAQAQAQAQAFQAAVGASATGGAGNNRNPAMWNLQGGAFQPPMLGGIPPNFFPHFQASAAQQQEVNMAQVATVKLGNVSKVPNKSSSKFVVRSSVRKFDPNGNIITVGMWVRKVVEDNLEWLVKLARRHGHPYNAIVLAFGDGCETLVLLDEHINKLPDNFSTLKKIGVGVSVADFDSKADQVTLAAGGVLQAGDSIWEHLHYQQVDANKTKKEKSLFIHTSHTIWSNARDGRRRLFQVKSKGASDPFMAVCYAPNPTFEQKAISSWAVATGGNPSGPTMVNTTNTTSNTNTITANTASVVVVNANGPVPSAVPTETLISFKPKQLLLLEKAFDNGLTPRDLKTDVKKTNAEDKKKCQSVIRRARDEIVTTTKKRRKKNPPAVVVAAAAKKPAPIKQVEKEKESTKKDEPKKKASPKKKAAKKALPEVKKGSPSSEQDNSDDEPISAMKATKNKRAKSKSPKKTETATRKRGRPSTSSTSKKESKRTRSKSRSKK